MASGQRKRVPRTTPGRDRNPEPEEEARPYDIDWSALMARAQEGDRQAYRDLLEQITPYLRTLATRRLRDPPDVEDAVQDILLTVHAIRHLYDPARPFGPWVAAIAHRRVIDRLRRQGRLKSREAPLTRDHETFPASRANIDEEVSDRRALQAALETLSPGQRQAIRLLKVEELSLNEAAARTGMSVTALKAATHRALKSLRRRLSYRSEET